MALIDESLAYDAIMQLANDLPNDSDEMSGTMSETRCDAPDASIVQHRQWREEGGVPHFRATIHYTPEEGCHMIGGNFIKVEVVGTFKESRKGLEVDEYHVEECRAADPHEHYVKPFWL